MIIVFSLLITSHSHSHNLSDLDEDIGCITQETDHGFLLQGLLSGHREPVKDGCGGG